MKQKTDRERERVQNEDAFVQKRLEKSFAWKIETKVNEKRWIKDRKERLNREIREKDK